MYKLSQAAAQDIEEILIYSHANFGLGQTEHYVEGLKNCLEILGNSPLLGTTIEEIRAGYRKFPYKSHIVFYKPANNHVFVVRILHRHMDVARHLSS